MLYDDEKNADLMITRYFLNGLAKGGSCIFFTDKDPNAIEGRLSAQGIDVVTCEKENRLRVSAIPTSDEGKADFLETLNAKAVGFEISLLEEEE
jgi:hypothetical protein